MNVWHPLLVLIAGWLWLSHAYADTVRLKTGKILEGTIVSETDANVRIEVEYAGGTILSTEIHNKDEIAEIVRSTPEQLAQRAMERAYANTQKYNLDPTTSYVPNHYRVVIDRVLRRFLADYPDSPYTNAIQTKLNDWIAEQGKVDSGMRKYRGVWMRPEEYARRNTEALAQAATVQSKAPVTATNETSAQRDIVEQVGEFLKRYWFLAIVTVVAMLWLCVHIFTHD